MQRLGFLTRTPPQSSPLIRRQVASWMSDDNDYNNLFKGLKSNVYDPSLKLPPRKRKHAEKLTLETDSSDYQAAVSVSLKVISSGYLSNTKSFMLVTNDQNYLVNAGESSMRYMNTLTLELGNQFKTPLCFHSPVDWNLRHNMKLNRPFIDQACQHVTQFDYNKNGNVANVKINFFQSVLIKVIKFPCDF